MSFTTEIVALGYPVVTLAVALEALGAPLPGEALMIALASAESVNHHSLVPVFLALWAGAVIGDNIGYLIGWRFGSRAIQRYGRRIGVTAVRYTAAERSFARYGVWIVLVARFVIILRQLNGLLAGALKLSWWRFVIANTVGGAVWVGFWLFLSSQLSGEILALAARIDSIKYIVLVASAIAAILLVLVWIAHLRLKTGSWWK